MIFFLRSVAIFIISSYKKFWISKFLQNSFIAVMFSTSCTVLSPSIIFGGWFWGRNHGFRYWTWRYLYVVSGIWSAEDKIYRIALLNDWDLCKKETPTCVWLLLWLTYKEICMLVSTNKYVFWLIGPRIRRYRSFIVSESIVTCSII